MKGQRWVKCIIVVLIIACLTFINIMGIPKTDIENVKNSMRYGIDIRGGISAVLEPDVENLGKVSIDDLDAVKEILDLRLEGQEIFDKYVNVDETNKRVVVEIPYKAGQDNNPQAALDEIGQTAMLTLRKVDLTNKEDNPSLAITEEDVSSEEEATKEDTSSEEEATKEDASSEEEATKEDASSEEEATKEDASSEEEATKEDTSNEEEATKEDTSSKEELTNEELWADNEIVIDGEDVEKAEASILEATNEPIVEFKLTDEGAKKFSEATSELSKLGGSGLIAIYLDDQLVSYPSVDQQISDGEGYISGNFNSDSAKKLANQISAGALPFKLKSTSVNSISPTLGEGSMIITVYAGLLAFLLVALFMILYYRLPGVIAVIALLGLVAGQLLVITSMGISLTLPGIAGIILTVGMGVDANIIIFERVKEELNSGKSLLAAIDMGFKRAFSAILDSNVTTMISATILLWLGSGPIAGFAKTLLIGVIISFISAIIATRAMIKAIASVKFLKKKWLYGAKGGEVKNA